jgi:hypothetical protein
LLSNIGGFQTFVLSLYAILLSFIFPQVFKKKVTKQFLNNQEEKDIIDKVNSNKKESKSKYKY